MESSNRQPVQFLVFGASVREGSFNKRLAELAADAITANGGEADLADMADFCAEAYSQDAQNETGFPAPIEVMRDRITANDAFVIACPEYNASMPGSLKNSIDWVSRFSPQPFNERHGLLMSASPSMVGGNRGLWALRVPLEHLGARVYPDMFSLAQAHQALGDRRLLDNELQDRFEQTNRRLHGLGRGLKALPVRQDQMGRISRGAARSYSRSSRVNQRPLDHRGVGHDAVSCAAS